MASSHKDHKLITDLDGKQVSVGPEDAARIKNALRAMHNDRKQQPVASAKRPISISSSAALEGKIRSQVEKNDSAIAQLIQQDLEREVRDEKKGYNPANVNQLKRKPLPPMNDKLAQSNLQSSFFKKLPTAILGNNISSLLDLKNQTALTQTCKRARHLFQPPLTEALEARLKQLLEHAVRGEMKEVEAIVAKNPSLLLHHGRVVDYTGRTIEGTAYQMALGAEDTQMAAMLKTHLIKIADEKTVDAQYNAQFPKDWEKVEEKQWAPIFTQLDTLTQAIKDATSEDIKSSGDPEYKLTVEEKSAVAKELAQFRLLLDATLKETVKTGRHFNPNLLLKAFQIYDNHYDDYFGNDWKDPRAMLFWQQAIGYVQRFMPANYVQAFCDGLSNTNEKLQKGTPQGRALKFETYQAGRWDPTDFYPLSNSHLGFRFAIYGWRRAAGGGGACGAGCADRQPLLSFEAYVNQKQLAYRAYSAPRP